MNELMITPEWITAMNLPGVNFMYPGDQWDSTRRAFRFKEAVAAYMADIRNIKIDPTPPKRGARESPRRHGQNALGPAQALRQGDCRPDSAV